MARREADREDLLAEGANMPQRGRITAAGLGQSWVVGWRKEGSLSLFVGQDPVFQFNALGQLRRAYVDGQKLAAYEHQLCRLVREPSSSGRLTLSRQPLSEAEVSAVQDQIAQELQTLRTQLTAGTAEIETVEFETVGITPDQLVDQLVAWLDHQPRRCVMATSPNVE